MKVSLTVKEMQQELYNWNNSGIKILNETLKPYMVLENEQSESKFKYHLYALSNNKYRLVNNKPMNHWGEHENGTFVLKEIDTENLLWLI